MISEPKRKKSTKESGEYSEETNQKVKKPRRESMEHSEEANQEVSKRNQAPNSDLEQSSEDDVENSEEANMDDKNGWEALPADILRTIFRHLPINDLLFNAPYTCKRWYEATLDPWLWQKLDFSDWHRLFSMAKAHAEHPFHIGWDRIRSMTNSHINKLPIFGKKSPAFDHLQNPREDAEAAFYWLLNLAIHRSKGSIISIVYPESTVVPNAIVHIRQRCPKITRFQLCGEPHGIKCWSARQSSE